MRGKNDALRKLNFKPVLFLTALIFLCNPNVQGLDILPDFVGYFLLITAFRRVSLLDESFAEASHLLRRMAWLSVAQLIGLVWIFTGPSAEEQPTLVLLLCFAIGVLELMTVLPACRQIFHGLSYIGSRMGGTVLFASANRQHSGDITDRACRRCQTFAVVKVALCILPELTSLTDATYRAGATLFNWYAYVHGFRAIAAVVGVIVGIVWLVRMARYLSRIAQDTPLWNALLARCEQDEAEHPERVPAKHLRRACTLAIAAFVFCLNFSLDGLNVFPGFVASVLLLLMLIPLGRYLPVWTRALCLCTFGLHAVVSGFVYVMTTRFFIRYDLYVYDREVRVKAAYDAVCVETVVEAVCFALLLGGLCCVIGVLIRRYTGAHGAASFSYTKEQIVRLRQRQLGWHLFPVLFFAILTAASHVAYAYLLPEYDFVWLPDVLLAILLILFATLRLRDFCDELDPKKMLHC
ncbi:MAG: hypothetical protein IIX15_02760 [Clostridia bacterium]|nr:hypothetical protein [Clostridia bacterium]